MYGQQYQQGMPVGYAPQQQVPDTNPSCMAMMIQPMTWGQGGAMPAVPPMTDLPQSVSMHGPAVAVALAQSLTSNAPTSPAIMFLYNVIAINGWRSEDWARMVEFAVMQVWSFSQTRTGAQISSLIQEAANNTVALKSSAFAVNLPPVMAHMQQGQVQEAYRYAQIHDQRRAEFGQMLASYTQQMQAQQNPQAHYGGLVGATLQQRGLIQPPAAAPVGLYVQSTAPQQQVHAYGQSAPVAAMPEVKPEPVKKKGPIYDIFADPKPEGKIVGDTLGYVTEIGGDLSGVAQEIQEPVAAPSQSWVPFEHQPYEPAAFTGTNKVSYETVINNTGEIVVFASVVPKTEEEMNTSEYDIPSLNAVIQRAVDARHGGDATKLLCNDMDLIAKGLRQTEVREDLEVVAMFGRAGMNDNGDLNSLVNDVHSLTHAIAQIKQDRILTDVEKKSPVYTLDASIVVNETVAEEGPELADAVKGFSDVGTFAQLASLMHQAVDACEGKPQALQALAMIDQEASKAFNYYLQIGLGLTGYGLDSIRSDVVDMIELVKIKKGRGFSDVISGFAKTFATNFFGRVEVERLMVDGEEGQPQIEKGNYVKIVQPTRISLVDVDSHSLRLDLAPGQAKELFESNYPGMHPFFNELADHNYKKGRNYFVTADNVIFGYDKSLHGNTILVIYKL